MKKLILLLIMLVSICACGSKNVVVEEFVGRDVNEVYTWCGQLDDDHSCEVQYEDNDEYEKDIVFEQSVKAGNKLKGDITFKVSSGAQQEIALPLITKDVTMSDIEVWKEASGIKNVSYVYETSDTVEKNHIIRLDPDSHVTKNTPLTVYVSSGSAAPSSTTIEIHYGDFIGLTVAEFEKKAKDLGLNPNHQTNRDKYDSDVKIDNIVWHGSGTYEKGEIFNYGVCINQITVNPGDYVGKTESEFIKIANNLSLNPRHLSDRDAYSAKIDKGNIVTHGSGVYVEGEDFNYGLSMGAAVVTQGYEGSKEEQFTTYLSSLTLKGDRKTINSETISAGRIVSYNYGKYSAGDAVTYYVSIGPEDHYVDVPDFSGSDESELLRFLTNNGIYAGTRTEQESLLPSGTIVSNDTGKKKSGDYVSYTVSTGPAVQDTAIIEAFSTVQEAVSHEDDYEHAEYDMKRYLFGRGFLDYEVVPVVYGGYRPGTLLSITIDGEELGEYPINVNLSAHIVCKISTLLQ